MKKNSDSEMLNIVVYYIIIILLYITLEIIVKCNVAMGRCQCSEI